MIFKNMFVNSFRTVGYDNIWNNKKIREKTY